MAAPVWEGEDVVDDQTTSITFSKPTGTVEDDLLFVQIAASGSSPGITPNGTSWTDLDEDGFATRQLSYTAHRVAGASEPSTYTFDNDASNRHGTCGGLGRISGIDTADPIDVSGFSSVNNDSSPDSPDVTTTVADTLVLRTVATDVATTLTAPGTEEIDADDTAGTYDSGTGLGWAEQASAGATGTATWTTGGPGNMDSRTGTIAIAPGAGGAAFVGHGLLLARSRNRQVWVH